MSQITQPTVIMQSENANVFNYTDEAGRAAYMKGLGAKNIEPPLPRSSHLKNKKTGLVFPWNDMLAEQRDIMENCDASGNTDQSAWMPTVINEEFDADAYKQEMAAASLKALTVSEGLQQGYMHLDSRDRLMTPDPAKMPFDAVPFDDLKVLLDDLEK